MTHRRDPPIWVQIPVLPLRRRDKMNEKINVKTIISMFVLLLGIIFYFAWNVKYGAWTDIGIYSVTIVLIGFGIAGLLLSMLPEKEG